MTDRRIVKSQAALREALVSCLKDAPLSQITVREVADSADVARKTFYQHYKDIDDLLIDATDAVLGQFFEGLRDEDLVVPLSPNGLLRHAVLTWFDNEAAIRAFVTNGLSNVLLQRLEIHALTLIQRIRAVNDLPSLSEAEDEYLATYLAGSTLSVASRWLRRGTMEDVVQITNWAERFAKPLIDAYFTK